MDNDFFCNAGIQSPIPILPPLSSTAMDAHHTELNCSSDQSPDCFLNWDKSIGRNTQFDSALSSMVSSPAVSNSNVSGDVFLMRDLIGKLGSIGNSVEIISTSCYSSPLNSPPKPNLTTNATVAEFSAHPGFAGRAAMLSCFGSRSFNGQTQFDDRSSPIMLNGKLPCVGVEQSKINRPQDRVELSNSQEESTVSDSNSKKRKAVSRTKTKVPESNANSSTKRGKCSDNGIGVKTEEETSTQKPPEPPKDYIHVRARRGQATDNHSLAERVRREKISERMKLLQDLVPGCNKFLSMKLSSMNTKLDFNVVEAFSKDVSANLGYVFYVYFWLWILVYQIFQSNNNSAFIGHHQTGQNLNGKMTPVEPLDSSLCRMPPLDEYCATPQIQIKLYRLNLSCSYVIHHPKLEPSKREAGVNKREDQQMNR